MGRLRELFQWVAAILIGGWLGGVVAAGAGGNTFSPAHWYWPVVWACLGVGVVLMAGYVLIGVIEERRRRSPAFAIRFAEDEDNSLMRFRAGAIPEEVSTTSAAASATVQRSCPCAQDHWS
jgi:hypothetical protein